MGQPKMETTGADCLVRARCTTDAGMLVLFDAVHFASITDQESWEEELLDDEDIVGHIEAGHLVPLQGGTDGRFEVEVRLARGGIHDTCNEEIAPLLQLQTLT